MSRAPLPPQQQAKEIYVQDVDKVISMAFAHTQSLVQKSQTAGGPFHWRVESEESPFVLYTRELHEDDVPSGLAYMATTNVVGTVTEVAEVLSSIQSFGLDVTSKVEMQTSPMIEPNDNVRVALCEYKPLGFMSKLETVVFHTTQNFVQCGRNGWVNSHKSLDSSLSDPSKGLSNHGSGIVCIESDQLGYIEVRYIVHMEFFPPCTSSMLMKHRNWAYARRFMRWCDSLKTVDGELREKRLQNAKLLTPGQLVPKFTRQNCFLCHQLFGWLKYRKVNCWTCGEVVCSTCCYEWRARGYATVCSTCSFSQPRGNSSVAEEDMLDRALHAIFDSRNDTVNALATVTSTYSTPGYNHDIGYFLSSPSIDYRPRISLIDQDLVEEMYSFKKGSTRHRASI